MGLSLADVLDLRMRLGCPKGQSKEERHSYLWKLVETQEFVEQEIANELNRYSWNEAAEMFEKMAALAQQCDGAGSRPGKATAGAARLLTTPPSRRSTKPCS